MGVTTPMSFAEFERLEWGSEQLELVDGELVRTPPRDIRTGRTMESLYWKLTKAGISDAHMLFGFLIAGEPASWLRPDVCVVSPDQPSGDYYLGAPLIAVEVVSPFDTAAVLQKKIGVYLANGAQEVWVLYPGIRAAHLHTANRVRTERACFQSPLLPGLELPFDEIFR